MHNAVLFIHLLGVVLLVGAVTTTLLAMLRVQTAESVTELRSLTGVTKRIELAIAPAMVIIIASGLYLVISHAGANSGIPWRIGWVDVSVIITVLLSVIGNTVEARDGKRLYTAINSAADELPSLGLREIQRAHRPIYVVFFGTSQVVALLFLMTNRPSLGVAITASVIAAVASAVAAFLRTRAVDRATAGPRLVGLEH